MRGRYRYSPKAFCIDNQPGSSQGKSTRKKANNSIEDPNQKDLFTENRSEASSAGSLTVYTDGACIKNPGGRGAWAFVILKPKGRQIELTQGFSAIVDEEDYDDLVKFKWHVQRNRNTLYAVRNQWIKGVGFGSPVLMHRQILKAGPGVNIDHWDCYGLNNRRYNLRFATASENGFNCGKRAGENQSSEFRGVYYQKALGKWVARCCVDGNREWLGSFHSEQKARDAYEEYSRVKVGDFKKASTEDIIHSNPDFISANSGFLDETTNNRAELTAVISALKAIPELTSVTVITDSQYVQLGASNWIRAWRKNNWRTKSRKGIGSSPVKNVDLWQELSRLTDTRYCKFKWVRGHNGDYWNEYCDRLATLGLSKLCESSH